MLRGQKLLFKVTGLSLCVCLLYLTITTGQSGTLWAHLNRSNLQNIWKIYDYRNISLRGINFTTGWDMSKMLHKMSMNEDPVNIRESNQSNNVLPAKGYDKLINRGYSALIPGVNVTHSLGKSKTRKPSFALHQRDSRPLQKPSRRRLQTSEPTRNIENPTVWKQHSLIATFRHDIVSFLQSKANTTNSNLGSTNGATSSDKYNSKPRNSKNSARQKDNAYIKTEIPDYLGEDNKKRGQPSKVSRGVAIGAGPVIKLPEVNTPNTSILEKMIAAEANGTFHPYKTFHNRDLHAMVRINVSFRVHITYSIIKGHIYGLKEKLWWRPP